MMTCVKTAILSGALVAIASGIVLADQIEKKGTSPYVTHFIFRPVQALEHHLGGVWRETDGLVILVRVPGRRILQRLHELDR